MSEKTVRRAIATMREELGAPIAFDSVANTFCYTRPCEFLPMVRIDAEEAFAFAMIAAIFAGAPDVPLGGAFASVLEKLKPILGGVVSFPMDEVRRAIALPYGLSEQEFRHIGPLIEATLQRRALRLVYQKAEAAVTEPRTVYPVRLVPLEQKWTLIAYDPRQGGLRHFLLVRIVAAERNGETFRLPAEVDLEAHLRGLIGRFGGEEQHEAKFALDAHAAFHARETKWHPEQTFAPLPDGREELTIRASSLIELKNRALRWCEHVEVLSPPALRDMVIDGLKHALARHEAAVG